MGTRFVYRVETLKGEGPYNNQGNWDMRALAADMCNKHYDSSHPGPYEDNEITTQKAIAYFLDEDHYFGFTDLDQLTRWFGSFIPRLGDLGFVVNVYEVDEDYVIETPNQCAFHRELAQWHTRYPIKAFHRKEYDNG